MKNRAHAARHFRFALPLIVLLTSASVASATMVEYSGHVWVEGTPVENAFVIAGTFNPDFNVGKYHCFYGVFSCNMGNSNYSRAVADDNFRPIGNGTHTSVTGAFDGSGSAADIDGMPIYLFVFSDSHNFGPADPDRTARFAIVSSSDPSWLAGDLNVIDGSEADFFMFGALDGSAIEPKFGPIPEPTSGVLFISGVLYALLTYRRRRFQRSTRLA